MKKIFVAMLALAAATACSNDELVSVNQEAIAFDNAFINNSVRSVVDPSLTASTLADFQVYGYVEGQPLFNAEDNGVTVYKNGGSLTQDQYAGQAKTDWKYEGTQYWIAGAKYNFAAVAPVTDQNWEKTTASKDGVTLSFTNNGIQDLLYAQSEEIEGKTVGNNAVAFTFRHLLSKVKFSFKNGYNASNATIKVYDITINNAYESANVALNATSTTWSDWAQNDTTPLTLEFGAATADDTNTAAAYAYNTTLESYNELFLIPGAITGGYEVSFKVALLVSGTQIGDPYEHTIHTPDTFVPVAGNSYDITAEITASNIDPEHSQEAIEFTVTKIEDWTENNTSVNIPEVNTPATGA